MGMCRITLSDGKVMHLPANTVSLREGHLCIKNADGGWWGAFAPGAWSHWVWVTMDATPLPQREP